MAHELAHATLHADRGKIFRACGPSGYPPPPASCVFTSDRPSEATFRYKTNCDEPEPTHKTAMEAFAKSLTKSAKVTIIGMASSDGDPDFNRSLSCFRAFDAGAIFMANGATVKAAKATGPVGAAGDATLRGVSVETEGVPPVVFPKPEKLPGEGLPPVKGPAPGFTGVIMPRDDFAGRSQTQFGVGETLDLSFRSVVSNDPAFFGGLVWRLVSGPGRLEVNPGDEKKGVARYKASNVIGNVRLQISSGGGIVLDTKDFKIVPPDGLVMSRIPVSKAHTNVSIPRWSCAFLARIHLRPTDVSFAGIELKEGDAVIQSDGWLAFKNGLHHCIGSASGKPAEGTNQCSFSPVSVGNASVGSHMRGCDTVGTGVVVGREDSFHDTTKDPDFGKLTWDIPWMFSVEKSAPEKFAIAQARITSDPAGTATIAKDGSETVTCRLHDPHSTLGTCG